MLISPRLQHHPIALFLFLTSLPFSYSKYELLRPENADPVDPTRPVAPACGKWEKGKKVPRSGLPNDPVVREIDPAFLEDLKKVFVTTTCHTYSMSNKDENYDTAQVDSTFMNWGMHALQWKGYNHIAKYATTYDPATGLPHQGSGFGGPGTFDADLANASDPPGEDSGASGTPATRNHVSCHGADRLDELEQASSGIFKKDGNPTDPTGSWNCLEEPDPFSAAVLVAMNMFYWNTPTYVDFSLASFCGGLHIEAVVVKEVTLCAEGPEPPHVACNWEDNIGATEVGSCEHVLVLGQMICGFFNGNRNPWAGYHYYEDEDSEGNLCDEWLHSYGDFYGDTAEMVFDPPAGTDVVALQERAHLTASKVLDPSELASMIERANSDTKGGMRGAAPGGKK